MSNAFYLRLAAQNIRKNRQLYLPYLLTCILTGAMFYIMNALTRNAGNDSVPGGDILRLFLALGSVIIGIFAVVFLFYTNSFLLRRRKRELGLFNVLGLEKRHLARVMGWESLLLLAAALLGSLAGGVVLNRLAYLLLLKIVRFPVSYSPAVCLPALGSTALLMCFVFLLILASNLFSVLRTKPIELLKSAQAGEQEPRTRWFLTLLGLVCLGSGYAIAILCKDPIAAILLFFLAALLVILGTYCLFTAGSVALLKALRRNKRYYYQPRHFTAVSGLLYRMKQNAVGLANVCILSTMVLVMLAGTLTLYSGMEGVLRDRYPADFSIYTYENSLESAEADAPASEAIAREDLNRRGLAPDVVQAYAGLGFTVSQEGSALNFSGSSASLVQLFCITAEQYEALSGQAVTLQPGQVLAYENNFTLSKTFTLAGQTWQVVGSAENFTPSKYTTYLAGIAGLVVPDQTALEQLYQAQNEAYGGDASQYISCVTFNTPGMSEEDQAAYVTQLLDVLRSNRPGESVRLSTAIHFGTAALTGVWVDGRAEGRSNIYTLYGGFLFLGLFLGILFLTAMVLIIYYKQVSEGWDDRDRFLILQKVGMGPAEVQATIRTQTRLVFFLPLAAALLHLAAAMPMMHRLLKALSLNNLPLFVACAAAVALVFTVVYYLIYRFTARVYYRIVRR